MKSHVEKVHIDDLDVIFKHIILLQSSQVKIAKKFSTSFVKKDLYLVRTLKLILLENVDFTVKSDRVHEISHEIHLKP